MMTFTRFRFVGATAAILVTCFTTAPAAAETATSLEAILLGDSPTPAAGPTAFGCGCFQKDSPNTDVPPDSGWLEPGFDQPGDYWKNPIGCRPNRFGCKAVTLPDVGFKISTEYCQYDRSISNCKIVSSSYELNCASRYTCDGDTKFTAHSYRVKKCQLNDADTANPWCSAVERIEYGEEKSVECRRSNEIQYAGIAGARLACDCAELGTDCEGSCSWQWLVPSPTEPKCVPGNGPSSGDLANLPVFESRHPKGKTTASTDNTSK